MIFYALAEEPPGELVLEILGPDGELIRRFSSERDPEHNPEHIYFAARGEVRLAKKPGTNRFVWNFRYPPVDLVPGTYLYGLTHGPRAKPGEYRARLRLGEHTSEAAFRILGDPRLGIAAEEYDRQLELDLRLWRDLRRIHDAARAIHSARDQITDVLARAAAAGLALSDLQARGDRLRAELEAIELALRQPRNDNSDDVENFEQKLDGLISYVYTMVDATERAPTAGQLEITADLERELEAALDRLRVLLEGDLAAFARDLAARGVMPLQVPIPRGALP